MSRFEALFEDEDDVFSGSPKSKFYDVVFNANNDIAREELDVMVRRTAAMEILLEEVLGSSDEVEKRINDILFTKSDEIESHAKNVYIHYTGAILSQSE